MTSRFIGSFISSFLNQSSAPINTIFFSRHLDLTDEEKEKLDGSYKVAKKLEKLQKGGQQSDSGTQSGDGSREESNTCGNDSPSRSLDSQGSSEKTSPDTSLVGSNGWFLYNALILFQFLNMIFILQEVRFRHIQVSA